MTQLPKAELSTPPSPAPAAKDDAVLCPSGPWPLWRVFTHSWCCPATTARHLAHVGLAKAFGIHIVCGLIWFFGATGLDAVLAGRSPFGVWGQMILNISQWPTEFLISLAIALFVVEFIALVLALLTMPWGACDEKLRSSLSHAMRIVWLQSMSVVVGTLVLMMMFFAVSALSAMRSWYGINWSERPWFVRHRGELWVYSACLVYAWALWTLLRAVGSRPVSPRADAPPTCQACGYNLTGTAVDGCCPECGENAILSVGPDARPGILWEQRGSVSWLQAWWRTSWDAIRQPRSFGRRLQIYSPPASHRRFVLLHMIAAGVVGLIAVSFWMAGFIMTPRFDHRLWEDFLWLMAPMTALCTGFSVLVIALLFAGVLGLFFSLGSGRSAMPVAMRCAAYLSGFVTLWAAANVLPAFLYGLSSEIHLLRLIAAQLRMGRDELALGILLLFSLPWLAAYLKLLYSMLQGARYATR